MRISSKHCSNRNKQPLVSVVIPVFDVEEFILEALISVLAQSYQNYEIIVVDDQSPDRSIELIRTHFSDPRIRIIRQKNRGLAGARNTGIRHANGEFIAFLDSDDYWRQDKLEHHVKVMLERDDRGVSFSSSLFVDKHSRSLNRLQAPKKKTNYTPGDIFCRNPIGNGSAPVIAKSVLENIAFQTNEKTENGVAYKQYFDETLRQSEDVECWTRIALKTDTKFHFINKTLTCYRVNNAGLSANIEAQLTTWLRTLQRIDLYAPGFSKQHGSRAMAFQYRYLARRSLTQGQAKNALRLMYMAYKTNTFALMTELGRTLETTLASVLLVCLPRKLQHHILSR